MRRHCVSSLRRAAVATLAIGTIVGCSSEPARPAHPSRHGASNYAIVSSEDTPRYDLKPNQLATTPVTGPHNATPVYPVELLPRNLPPVTIVATLIVGTNGLVKDVRFADTATTADAAVFQQSVNTAVTNWTFTPLRIAKWETRPDGSEVRVASQAEPFSQAYEFHFKVVDGKGVVSN